MPELPDVAIYVEALERRIAGRRIEALRLTSPFVLRTAVPPIIDAVGRRVAGIRRVGKRIVIELEGELFLLLHLMIAGRLRWQQPATKPPARITLATFAFDTGVLVFTEAGTRKRASLHLVDGDAALAAFDRGGVEIQDIDAAAFAARIKQENHTLKRALTDPRLFSGIGNAYSDEILHRARLSPLALTHKLTAQDTGLLFTSAKAVLAEWTERLRREAGEEFPEGVTAFRPQMAVHGRFGKPCPDCGAPV
ncbi:MAG: DNA-formamidopyrimidine glycosylase family protein, partial [Betaproteobacteria bacterium]